MDSGGETGFMVLVLCRAERLKFGKDVMSRSCIICTMMSFGGIIT